MMAAAAKRRDPYGLMRRGRAFRRMKRNQRGHHSYWWHRGQMALAFEEGPHEALDKTEWGDGPWQHEPDRVRWEHHPSGLACLVQRSHTGALCGYVCVRNGHPYFRTHYDRIDVAVHGGLTFSEQLGPAYWIGFDCGHYRDFLPALAARLAVVGAPTDLYFEHDTYRDLSFVYAETERLAEQVSAAQ